MKKLLLALTLILCLSLTIVAFTSCGGNGEGEGEGTGEGGACEHTWANTATTDKAPTCTEEGVESIKCTSCGEKKADSDVVIPAIDHNYVSDSITAPTCTTAGSEIKTCTACGATTTVELPATGEHVWRANAVIDVMPTCTEPGSKSIKCIYCQGTKEDSVEFVPATGHTEAPIVLQPTVFSDGLAEGECTTCGNTVSQVIPKTEAKVEFMTSGGGGERRDYADFYNILGDDHFYPTEENPSGNSLYVEFSLLWNETLANVKIDKAYTQIGRINGPSDVGAFVPWYITYAENCTAGFWLEAAGGFQVDNAIAPAYGPVIDANTKEEDFPNIGEYGWHRIGLVYTQVTEDPNAPAGSNMLVSLYIDGVMVSSYYHNADERCILYTGDSASGYADNIDAKVLFYRLTNYATTGEDAYYVVADAYASIGGFVINATPVENPADATFTVADGVDLPAKAFFSVVSNG